MYGLVAGIVVAFAVLPLRGQPRLVRRLRLVWGALAAAAVFLVSVQLAGPPELEPGPNETMRHVTQTLVMLFAIPGGLAFLAATLLVPPVIHTLAREAGASAPAVDPIDAG